MLRHLCAIFGCALLLSASRAPPALEMTLAPVVAGGAFVAIDVAVAFNGESDGETVLELPDAWGGEERLWQALRYLRVDGAAIAAGEGPAHRVLRHAPGARIAVRYRVVQETPGAPEAGGRNPYRPVIQPAYFHVLGNAILATPADIDQRTPARLTIVGMPAGAVFASDAQHPALTVKRLAESVIVGGDFRVLDAGGGVRVAIRAAWPIQDAAWRERIARIGAAQRAYWDADGEPYLVTILPLAGAPGSISVGGTGRDDAFAFFATPNASLDMISRILSHEMMHTWIPGRIGGLPEKDEAADYWFSEGFTDWAAWRVNVRSGVWRIEDFALAFNEALAAYDLSPVRTAPNARIVEGFWATSELQKLPYRRGMLIATVWDHRLRTATGGGRDLDDVLMRLLRGARMRPDVTAVHLLPEALRRVGGVGIGAERTELVAEGRVVPLPTDIFAPCGLIVMAKRPLWVRGFDFSATQRADWVIRGVEEGNAAWRAGLRNGMRLRSWSETSADRDAAKPVTAGVDDGGVRREVTWMPTDGATRDVRRFELEPDMNAAERATCRRRLAGA